jgi:hypothetical protein
MLVYCFRGVYMPGTRKQRNKHTFIYLRKRVSMSPTTEMPVEIRLLIALAVIDRAAQELEAGPASGSRHRHRELAARISKAAKAIRDGLACLDIVDGEDDESGSD